MQEINVLEGSQITRLPDGVQVTRPIPVVVTHADQGFTADCKNSLGILVCGQGNTPDEALERLCMGLATQFRLVQSARLNEHDSTSWIEETARTMDEYMSVV